MEKLLVTGTTGFIGFTLSKRLLERGDKVVGLDNLNDYYDIDLEVLEDCLGKKADKNLLPIQAGDVPSTHADNEEPCGKTTRDCKFKKTIRYFTTFV